MVWKYFTKLYFDTNQGNYTKSSYIWLYCHYHIGFSTECMYISTKGIFTGGQNAATSICTQSSQDQDNSDDQVLDQDQDQDQCKGKGNGQVHGPALGEALGTIRITQLCPRCVAERSVGTIHTPVREKSCRTKNMMKMGPKKDKLRDANLQNCPQCSTKRVVIKLKNLKAGFECAIGMLATSTAATRPFSDLLKTNLR